MIDPKEALIAAIEKLPSPEGCGCKARKETLITFLRTGHLPGQNKTLEASNSNTENA